MKARLSITVIIAVGLALTVIAYSLPTNAKSLQSNIFTAESGITGNHSSTNVIAQISDTVSWIQLHPIISPPALADHAMAYDSARGRVVLFGGYGPNRYANDTWEWDGANWIQQFPATLPGVRSDHAMAYDSARGRVVLFGGGVGSAPSSLSNETWEWDGFNWIKRFPVNMPSAREGHAMAYDETRGRVVLFSGWNGTNWPNDTWEWDGTNWTQRFPTTSPSGRNDHAMAYDSGRSRVILFGGSLLTDTWEWDGVNWEQRFPNASPSARSGHAMVYDRLRGRIVLFGEWNGNSSLNDTWEWDGTNWLQRFPSASPPARFRNAMAYDSQRKRVVLFGGTDSDGSRLGDTWEYYESVHLSTTPASRTLPPGSTTFFSVTVEGLQLPLTLTVSAPQGVSGQIYPSSVVTPPTSATLMLTTSPAMADDVYPVTLTGQGTEVTATTNVTLNVVTPNFGIVPSGSPWSIYPGTIVTYNLAITATATFTALVTLDLAGLPADTTGTFTPNPASPGSAVALWLTTSSSTMVGAYNLVITGTGDAPSGTGFIPLLRTATAILTVLSANITPTVSPGSRTVYRGQSVSFLVNLSATPGFTLPAALEVGQLPQGTSFSFAPAKVSPGASAMLLVTTTSSTPLGIYQLAITSTAASLVRTTYATLEVKAGIYLPIVFKRWPPIPYKPDLSTIDNADGDGNYTVYWTEQPSRLADIYTLQEATDAAFTTNLRDVCTTAQQFCTVSGKPVGTYYYQVRGYNTWGYGEWSNLQSTTVLSTGTPTLNAIDNSDQDNKYNVTWSTAARATSYTLQEDTDFAFSHPQSVYSGAQTSWAATGKTPATFYYRVLANGPTGQSDWSNVQSVVIHPLFVGLQLRWDGSGYIRGSEYYDVGTHATRDLNGLTDADTIRSHYYHWYDPNPENWASETWDSYYSVSTGYFKSSSVPGDPSWKWGNPWVMPYDWRLSNGQTFIIDGKAFLVSGPYSGYTAFGKAVQYWKLINRDKFLYWDGGGNWKQYVHPGDITLWYDAGSTRLELYSNVLRRYYYKGNLTSDTVQYIENLTSSNSFPSMAMATKYQEDLQGPGEYYLRDTLSSGFDCAGLCAGNRDN
jgi:hypothetical protein